MPQKNDRLRKRKDELMADETFIINDRDTKEIVWKCTSLQRSGFKADILGMLSDKLPKDYIILDYRHSETIPSPAYCGPVIFVKARKKSESELFAERMEYFIGNLGTQNYENPYKKLKPLKGHCSECDQKVKGWKPVFGAFAPEWWASVREDPGTGHKLTCSKSSE